MNSYPKVWNLGHAAIVDLLKGPVTVEEKVDGSQFSFGIFNGALRCRSKSIEQDSDGPDGMFTAACATARELHQQNLLPDGWTFRAECLRTKKHNTLCYERTPVKFLILFDIDRGDQSYLAYEEKAMWADRIGLEVVPRMYDGEIADYQKFRDLLATTSCLGGVPIEGLVIKNYARFTPDGKAMMGKYVSEAFKETHSKDWKTRHQSHSDIKIELADTLRTPARWTKAVQRLRDRGELTNSPKDIGQLFKEVNQDILEECKAEVADKLFAWFWRDASRIVTRGLPEWYKDQLAQKQFGSEGTNG